MRASSNGSLIRSTNAYYILGNSIDSIAEKYNIGSSTVSEICKRKLEIETAVEKNKSAGFGKIRKTLRESNKPLVESELASWYHSQLEHDIKPSGSILIQKAKEINLQLIDQGEAEPDVEWNPTKGWLMRFKERYGIKSETKQPDQKPATWQSALDAAEFLLEYINERDFLLKDVITVRMIRDRIASEQDNSIVEGSWEN